MEQGTLIGTILAWLMLLMAMAFDFTTFQLKLGNLQYFVDAPSLMIVFGGTIASTLIAHPMGDAKGQFNDEDRIFMEHSHIIP